MYSIHGFPHQDTYKVSYPSEKKMGNTVLGSKNP